MTPTLVDRQADTICDDPDTCVDGTCQNNNEPVTTACGDAEAAYTTLTSVTELADVADNGFKPADTSCGDSTDNECNNPDHCSGIDGAIM